MDRPLPGRLVRTLSLAAAAVVLGACELVTPLLPSGALGPTPPPDPFDPPQPPEATLVVAAGPAVAGAIGGYTWDETGSGSPWLPGAGPVSVAAGASVTVALPPELDPGEWTASYVPRDGRTVGDGTPVALADGTGEPIAFDAPPPGTWSVLVSIDFPGRGDVAYYWAFETS